MRGPAVYRAIAHRGGVLLALVLAGCQEGLFFDPASEAAAALQVSFESAEGVAGAQDPGSAFDKADGVRVAVLGLLADEVVLDLTQDLQASAGTDRTVRVELPYEGPALVGVGLLVGGEFLFVGAASAQLVNGETTPVTVSLQSIISDIAPPGGPVVLQGVGRTTQLTAEARFATGDTDPTAPLVWSSTSPNISVTPSGLVTAQAPGPAEATATWSAGVAEIPELGLTFPPVMETVQITVDVPGEVRLAPADVGTDPTAVATLQEALDIVGPGGTVRVADGVHPVANVRLDDPVTIEGEGTGAVIRGSSNVMAAHADFALSRLRLEGVRFEVAGPPAETGSLDDVTVASTSTDGIWLSFATGTFTFTDTHVEDVDGVAFRVSSGSPTVTFGGSIVNTTGDAVSIANSADASIVIDAAITDTGRGIHLQDNPGGTVRFAGTLDLAQTTFTQSAWAFRAINGGTVEVTGAGNRIETTVAVGVEILGADIGPAGVTFASVSATGARSGIILSNTGTQGSFSVTGDGSTLGSGGTIQGSTTVGVVIDRSLGASLSFMEVLDSNSKGIEVTSSTGFGLDYTVVDGSGSAVFGPGVQLEDVDGTIAITSSAVVGSGGRGVDLTTTRTADVTITNSALQNSGEHGVFVHAPGGAADIAVLLVQNDISQNSVDGVHAIVDPAGALRLETDANAIDANGDEGVELVATGDGSVDATLISDDVVGNGQDGILVRVLENGQVQLVVDDASILDQGGAGIHMATASAATNQSRLAAKVVNNTISGGSGQRALSTNTAGATRVILQIENNLIDHAGSQEAVDLQAGFGSVRYDATVVNNTVQVGPGVPYGIVLDGEGSPLVCGDVRGNVVSGVELGIAVRQRGGSFALERLNDGTGFVTNPFIVEDFVSGENPAANGAFAEVVSMQGVPDGTCQLP